MVHQVVAGVLLVSTAFVPPPLAAASDVPVTASPIVAGSPPDSLATLAGPSENSLAKLRRQIDDRSVRVWMGEQRYQMRRVQLSSAGVAFDSANVLSARPGDVQGQPPLSPIAWQQVDRIESCHPHGLLGAVLGAFAGLILAGEFASNAGSDPGPGIVVVLFIPPATAILGGLVGHSIQTWEAVWSRSPAGS
jgi:hypothetical protein